MVDRTTQYDSPEQKAEAEHAVQVLQEVAARDAAQAEARAKEQETTLATNAVEEGRATPEQQLLVDRLGGAGAPGTQTTIVNTEGKTVQLNPVQVAEIRNSAGDEKFNAMVKYNLIPQGSVYINEQSYIPATQVAEIKASNPELGNILATQGYEAYQKRVEQDRMAQSSQLATFEASLANAPKELQDAYRTGGVAGYNSYIQENYVKLADGSLVSKVDDQRMRDELSKITDAPNLLDAYVRGGLKGYNSELINYQENIAPSVSSQVDADLKYQSAITALEPYKQMQRLAGAPAPDTGLPMATTYDIIGYMRDSIDPATGQVSNVAMRNLATAFPNIENLAGKAAAVVAIAKADAWKPDGTIDMAKIQRVPGGTGEVRTIIPSLPLEISIADVDLAFENRRWLKGMSDVNMAKLTEAADVSGVGSYDKTLEGWHSADKWWKGLSNDDKNKVINAYHMPTGSEQNITVMAQFQEGVKTGAAPLPAPVNRLVREAVSFGTTVELYTYLGIPLLAQAVVERKGDVVGLTREMGSGMVSSAGTVLSGLGGAPVSPEAFGESAANLYFGAKMGTEGIAKSVEAGKGIYAYGLGIPSRAGAIEADVARIPWNEVGYASGLKAVSEILQKQILNPSKGMTEKMIVDFPDKVFDYSTRVAKEFVGKETPIIRDFNLRDAKEIPNGLASRMQDIIKDTDSTVYGSFVEWLHIKDAVQPKDVDIVSNNAPKVIDQIIAAAKAEGYEAKAIPHGVTVKINGVWTKVADVASVEQHLSMIPKWAKPSEPTIVNGIRVERIGDQLANIGKSILEKDETLKVLEVEKHYPRVYLVAEHIAKTLGRDDLLYDTVGRMEITMRKTPMQQAFPKVLYHATPDATGMLKELSETGKITFDGMLFTSPQEAMDFLRGKTGNLPRNPAIIAIRVDDLTGFKLPFKEYKGAVEAEVVGLNGVKVEATPANIWSKYFGKGVTGETFTQYKGVPQRFLTELVDGKEVKLDKPISIRTGQLIPQYWVRMPGVTEGAPSFGALRGVSLSALAETIKDIPYLRLKKIELSYGGFSSDLSPFRSTRSAYDAIKVISEDIERQSAETVINKYGNNLSPTEFAKKVSDEMDRRVAEEATRILSDPEVAKAMERSSSLDAYKVNLANLAMVASLGTKGLLDTRPSNMADAISYYTVNSKGTPKLTSTVIGKELDNIAPELRAVKTLEERTIGTTRESPEIISEITSRRAISGRESISPERTMSGERVTPESLARSPSELSPRESPREVARDLPRTPPETTIRELPRERISETTRLVPREVREPYRDIPRTPPESPLREPPRTPPEIPPREPPREPPITPSPPVAGLSRLQTNSPMSQPVEMGSIAWVSGSLKGVRGVMTPRWWYIPPPYDKKPIPLSAPPTGATWDGSLDPHDTIQIIGTSRAGVPNRVDTKIGWADITVINGREIEFAKDNKNLSGKISNMVELPIEDAIQGTPVNRSGFSRESPNRIGKRVNKNKWLDNMTSLRGMRP